MPAANKNVQTLVVDPSSPASFGSLCMELSDTGKSLRQSISSMIDGVATSPGKVVYLHCSTLALRLNGLQPVIFSAIDAATHLQVAEANFARTSASALTFIDFVAQSFPFTIKEIKTRKEPPFSQSEERWPHRDFPALIEKRGYLHSYVGGDLGDPLFKITSKMVFGGLWEGLEPLASSDELQRTLTRYLLFHNHFRFVPWLEGKTPIQQLRTFASFAEVHSLDLRVEPYGGHSRTPKNSLEATGRRTKPGTDFHQHHNRTA